MKDEAKSLWSVAVNLQSARARELGGQIDYRGATLSMRSNEQLSSLMHTVSLLPFHLLALMMILVFSSHLIQCSAVQCL